MGFKEKYFEAYERLGKVIQERLDNGKLVAMGYTSNLDLFCDFRVERLNELLNTYMPNVQIEDMTLAKEINTMEDMLKSIVYYCKKGIGGEIDVINDDIVRESFNWLVYGIGGTAVQGAMALAAINCSSFVHLTDDSKEVCDILESPYIYTVNSNGHLVHTNQIENTAEQEIHFVIQFQKGQLIKWKNNEIRIPRSNRCIITKVTVNEFVPLSKSFLKYIENHAGDFGSNLLSSFNCISDINVLRDRLIYIKAHVKKVREVNPDCVIIFEDAHYHDDNIRQSCIDNIYSNVDIVSLNEDELAHTSKLLGFSMDIEDVKSCIEAAKFIRDKYDINNGIIIHTKDYSMYVGEKLKFDIGFGLMCGNMLATAKAEYGFYGTMREVKQILKHSLSANGIKAANIICNSKYKDEVILVPTCYIDRPKFSIGLGDSFIAGLQICF